MAEIQDTVKKSGMIINNNNNKSKMAAEAIFLLCTVHFSVTISIFYASLDAMIHSETVLYLY